MAVRIIAILDKGGLGTEIVNLGSLTFGRDPDTVDTKAAYRVQQVSKPNNDGVVKKVREGRVSDHYAKKMSVWRLVSKGLTELGHPDDRLLKKFIRHVDENMAPRFGAVVATESEAFTEAERKRLVELANEVMEEETRGHTKG